MPKYKITYYREYEIETHTSGDALGITDQSFTDDIRKTLIGRGIGKISYLFKFDIKIIK